MFFVKPEFIRPEFLLFFAVVFGVYWWLSNHRGRMLWLLAASCFFYMGFKPWLILLILFSASVDYFAALALEKPLAPIWRRALLIGSITINLSLLGFFKYMNFFLDNISGWFNLGWPSPFWQIALPLGISFYTFETISYVVDVYLGRARAVRSLLDYSLYIMFFPHLVAGPIVRPRDFLPQLQRTKRWDWDRLHLGLRLFLLGFFKKAVLADHLGAVADPIFKNPGQYDTFGLWLGVLAYTIQIYGDFSGYSDMAIGIAHTFGFKLPANFNMPYLAVNIADFWRRWHISLSSWLRDYLYIPLGGSRGGEWATYRNLLITMFLGGLWHGASWTFVLWGAFHGSLLAIHRALAGRTWTAWLGWPVLAQPLTLLMVCIGWVLFRANSLTNAGTILGGMFYPTTGTALPQTQVLLVLAGIAIMILGHAAGSFVKIQQLQSRLPEPVWGAILAGFLLLILMKLPEDGKGFIYFQF